MEKKRNQWSRWRPFNPILDTSDRFNLEWVLDLDSRAKSFYDDKESKEGDIIHQEERKITIAVSRFVCPECHTLKRTEEDLASHLMKEHDYDRTASLKIAKFARTKEITKVLKRVHLYYQVVKPKKILSLPLSVEVDISERNDKGTKAPTAYRREKHDKKMKEWREKMKTQERKEASLRRLPNGLFQEPGASKNWWYYIPQVWRQEAKKGEGRWLRPNERECLNWKKLKLPKRILSLICIVSDS